ncbi:hypothetical protein HDK90DRAFT_538795 [Phyllosticta capitalensis]|uniref:N,N-dimethylformamidase beta subunit-like C-terminal domain-containing protein n=1 Tax=Phyllosticta capitalensis TaxID=121624 RepID=A0ABR1Z3E4_9PEZI
MSQNHKDTASANARITAFAASQKDAPEIIGYVEPWITSPGDTVDVKVSSTVRRYQYQLVRLIQGLDHPKAAPLRKEVITAVPRGTCTQGRRQRAQPGSYAIVDCWGGERLLATKAGFAARVFVQPWLPQAGHAQTLLSTLDAERKSGVEVVIGESGCLALYVGTGRDVEVVRSSIELRRWRWAEVRVEIKGREAELSVRHLNRLLEDAPALGRVQKKLKSDAVLYSSGTPLLFGAGSATTSPQAQSSHPSNFFNGRLDSPAVSAIESRESGSRPPLVHFDFSVDIPTDSITDVSGNARHGRLVNAPSRAVKGYDWDGSEPDWTKAKFGYGAIHFHEDDLDDAAWETDFKLTIPSAALSGAYAVEAWDPENPKLRDSITFFVRPGRLGRSSAQRQSRSSQPDVAIVLSTFTYLAYANEHMYDESKRTFMEVPGGATISESEDFYRMVRRSDLGLSMYDEHRDGSGSVFSSSKRPILNVRPGYIMWAFNRPREFSADLLAIGFLEERLGRGNYDVVTDHDLHMSGVEALSGYKCVLTGCHPEYPSLESLNAYAAYAREGGSIMFLGGNGFYWVSVTDPKRPHRLEVRRSDQGCRSFGLPAGETIHSLNGQQGALWRSRGRPAQSLFGIGSAACGTGPGVPYAPTAAAHTPEFYWLWDKIPTHDRSLIGVEGFGGGASGDEIDRLDFDLGTPLNAVLLASSLRHSDKFGLFNEEQMFPMVDTLGPECERVRSDMVFYETAAGGYVFSVGSINWYSSLAYDAYRNNCAQLTENVMRRFVALGKRKREARL